TDRAAGGGAAAGGRGLFPGRAACLLALAQAFRAARLRRTGEAWGHLCRVTPEDLNAWERQVYAGVQALLLLEEGRGERPPRALRLARQALPTGNAEVDRRFACALLVEAWGSPSRLQDVVPTLRSAGAPLAPLAFLGGLRLRYLQAAGGRPGAEPGTLLARVWPPTPPCEVETAVEWARKLGDGPFAEALRFAAVRRAGPYRLRASAGVTRGRAAPSAGVSCGRAALSAGVSCGRGHHAQPTHEATHAAFSDARARVDGLERRRLRRRAAARRLSGEGGRGAGGQGR
ncbi:MAG TPA: hypothetical protein VFS00_14180, partial [Polyangiaceae bacterium]|nr:hypothetical protein [Polyangiaceae bacterium]